MPKSVRFKGTDLWRPGVVTYHNLDGLLNLDLGAEAAAVVIGEATAGEPQVNATNPVVHAFTNANDMIAYFQGGNLAEAARFLFDPAKAGQTEQGVPIRGCKTVYAIKVNQSSQGSYTINDGAAHDCVTFKGRIYGALDNQTWFKLGVSGTGLKLTAGRDVAPDIGEQVSATLFSVTGIDEWLSVTYTGVAATATMAFDGTTFTTTTAGAVDDLSIAVAGLTVQDLIDTINATASGDYTATLLRADRADTLAAYIDRFTGVNIRAVVASQMGVAWDIVEWTNNNSAYMEATWVGGYEPQTYSKTYLAGGALGGTTESVGTTRVSWALKVATALSPRFLVSCFNADVDDEAAGTTTLDTINAAFNLHATNTNVIGAPTERQVFITSDETTKAGAYTAISAFNNDFVACVIDELYRENELGVRAWMGTHCTACAVAAIMAGSPIATPLTHKYINAYNRRPVCTDFDPTDDTDFQNGISNGILFLESVPGSGIRVAKDITTHVSTDNDARRYLHIVEARIRHRVIMRRLLDGPFTGTKGKGQRTAQQILRKVQEAHRQMADTDDPDFILVEGSDEDGNVIPPYRQLQVSITGDQVYITGEITFVEGINWIISDIRATLPQAVVGG